GPGMATNLRKYYGYNSAVTAHSEFTRLLAEHGLFGLLSMFALIFLSIREYSTQKKQGKCILVCFTIIAILTMLHSAMRLAMPGFIFGFGFFKLITLESIHQKQ
ncbi:uncharacterized protein METZ01_LOCUS319939, partial [marine metagenome]